MMLHTAQEATPCLKTCITTKTKSHSKHILFDIFSPPTRTYDLQQCAMESHLLRCEMESHLLRALYFIKNITFREIICREGRNRENK
jgi:hypothetical protein